MISVLINNYNYAGYLEQAVESVIHQTYEDWELIIVDDGSKDCSAEIIKRYVEKYPKKIRGVFKENGGQASAVNAGFALAGGSIIAFLDSDDYWFPEKLEEIAKAHREHDYVVNNFRSNGPEVSRCNKRYIDQSSYLLKKYGYQVLVSTPTSSISIKKNILDNFFPIPEEEYKISADAYIDLFSLYFSNYYYIDKALTFYRQHDLNSYYGNESASDTGSFVGGIIENVNIVLAKKGLEQIPFRSIDSQRVMYKELEKFEIKENERYIIYGAGDIGRHVMKLVHRCGGSIVCFCDGNSSKKDTLFFQYKIILAEDLWDMRDRFDKIIIASTFYAGEIEKRLISLGFLKGRDYIYTSLFCDHTFDTDNTEIYEN